VEVVKAMLRRATALIGFVALLIATSPAAAKSVPSVVRITTMGAIVLSEGEREAITGVVAHTLNLARARDAWRCVTPMDVGSELPPLPGRTGVDIDVIIRPNPSDSDTVLLTVEVQATGRHAANDGGSVAIPRSRLGLFASDREGELQYWSVQALEPVLARLHPCTPKLKARGKTAFNTPGFEWQTQFEGEVRLALREDGSFTGSMPITHSWSPIVATIPGLGTATCSISGNAQDTAELEGEYDDADGSLKFNHMRMQGITGQLTSTCTAAGETGSYSMAAPQTPRVDAAAETDMRVALQDGATKIFPFSSAGMTGDIELDLSYDEETGPSVATGPRPSDLMVRLGS
jgi:hypothetical protein